MASINPFLPIQEGTGDPSPENVRPIKPAVSIAGGKNLLKIDSSLKRGSQSFLDLGLTETGVIVGDSPPNGGFLVRVKPNMTYTFSFDSEYYGGSLHIRVWKDDIKSGAVTLISNLTNTKTTTFTTDSETEYIRCGFYAYGLGLNQTILNMQLEEGSIATSYEPYQTLDIYGGYLDIMNSRIVEELTYKEYNGSESWTKGTAGSAKDFMMKKALPTSASFSVTNLLSNYLQTIANNATWGNYDNWISWTFPNTINTGIQSITTVEDWKSYLALNPLQVVYKLATPVTHYLSHTQLAQAMEQLGIKLSSTLIDARRKILLNSPHLETASGSIANFSTDMKAPLKECKIHFLPVQSGSGDPSPDNVRPITGWTGVNVEHSGKNVAHITGFSAKSTENPYATKSSSNNYGTTISTTSFSLPDTELVITQTQSSETAKIYEYQNGYFVVDTDSLEFGENYLVSFRVSNVISNLLNANLSDIRIAAPSGATYSPTVYGDRLVYNYRHIQRSNLPNQQNIAIYVCTMSFTMSEFMVTPISDEDTTFEPYQSTQIPISFGDNGTIYGGYVDLVSGEVIQTHKSVILDGSESWGSYKDSQQMHFWLTLSDKKVKVNSSISSIFPNAANISFWDAELYSLFGDHNSIPRIYVNSPYKMPGLVTEWKAYLNEHPMQICYELATPITYQLTPQQLKSLKGINNIWSDANGDIEVKFWKH